MEKYWKPWMTGLGLATVWIWFCLSSVVWSLFVVLQWFGIEDKAADWVQAIGSVVAILAAGYFPIRHLELAKEKREQSLLELMRVLAGQANEAIWLLSNSFTSPDREISMMREYVRNHRADDFEPLLAGLDQVPVAELPPMRVVDLGQIRSALKFAAEVAAQLPEWLRVGSSHPEALVTLRAKRDLLTLTIASLPVPEGMTNVVSDAQRRGQKLEKFLEPVTRRDHKVYRRFIWVEGQDFPERVQVQIVAPESPQHPETYWLPSSEGAPWWESFEQAERAVLHTADARIHFMVLRQHRAAQASQE